MTIYRAVMKPAFPTVVYLIPNCWKLLARNRKKPQVRPPFRSRERSCAEYGCEMPDFLPERRMNGRRTKAPIRLLVQLKVNPPT